MPASRTTNLNCLARTTTLQGIQVPGSEEGDNRKVSKIQINNYRQKGMEGLALVACHSSCNPNRILSLSFVCGRGFDHWQSLTMVTKGIIWVWNMQVMIPTQSAYKTIKIFVWLWSVKNNFNMEAKNKDKNINQRLNSIASRYVNKRISYLRTASLCCSLTVQPNLFIYKGSANTTYMCSSNQ